MRLYFVIMAFIFALELIAFIPICYVPILESILFISHFIISLIPSSERMAS